jgi:hypothetical protein
MNGNRWARLLAYVTGLVNQELLRQNEYLAAENRILRAHLPARLPLSDAERCTLAEIAKRLGTKALEKVACGAKPDTILAWYQRLIARKFDGSPCRTYPGRPRISAEVTELVVRFARENSGWGYDRIAGALPNLGHHISDQTVGDILRRHDIAPAPKRSQTTTWWNSSAGTWTCSPEQISSPSRRRTWYRVVQHIAMLTQTSSSEGSSYRRGEA